jgi:hypothetical protein
MARSASDRRFIPEIIQQLCQVGNHNYLVARLSAHRGEAPGGGVALLSRPKKALNSGNTPHPGKMLDMMMLVGPGGQERTEEEYGALLGKAGLRLTRVAPTESPVSVVEARAC